MIIIKNEKAIACAMLTFLQRFTRHVSTLDPRGLHDPVENILTNTVIIDMQTTLCSQQLHARVVTFKKTTSTQDARTSVENPSFSP